MDTVRNPYAPGAGTPPPELAGRLDVLEAGKVALQRVVAGRAVRTVIMVGLRGVGKTVLLNRLQEEANLLGFRSSLVEAHEGKRLAELLAPSLRSTLYHLSTVQASKELARKSLRGLKGFLKGLKISVSGMDFGLSFDAEAGLADSGNIEADLPELICSIGEAAKAATRPIALFMDELQYLDAAEFSALIMSIHRTNQRRLPVVLIGAGLPQILGLAGNSKSYAERLFRFMEIGALGRDEAIQAIMKPAEEEGVKFSAAAIESILDETARYPYFLQQWAYEAWNIADDDKITLADAKSASVAALKELDQSFFKVRFDRCTPAEKKYMRALAEFGTGKHRSGEIADRLKAKSASVAPIRSSLIKKGMIYSPAHGDTEFTVPLFDEFMRRAIPLSTYESDAD